MAKKNNPTFPIYIVSKGRADSRLTVKALNAIGVPYHVVVEEQEFDAYARVINPTSLLILDPTYKKTYEYCDATRKTFTGPGPARNFAWDHAKDAGFAWHWVMDDNIRKFCRLNRNLKVPVSDGAIFAAMEDFVLRYDNVAMAGPQYFMFAPRKNVLPPFVINTRIYSCNLIRNDIPFRWRGRYNEDTILSLDILKAGWVTVQFNAFLQYKVPTQTVRGGNMESYAREGTFPKSDMLLLTHPDVSRVVFKFRRWHHHVDYRGFTQTPKKKDGLTVPVRVNNYGMELFTAHEPFRASGKKNEKNAIG